MTTSDKNVIAGPNLVVYLLSYAVTDLFGDDVEFKPQNDTESMPDYPFFTFLYLDPEDDTTADWLGDTRQYLTHLQIDAHATSLANATDMAQQLYAALHEPAYKRLFKQCNIVPQTLSNFADRTSLQGINLDNDVGFDAQILVTGNKAYDTDKLNYALDNETSIENAVVSSNHSTINAKK